MLDIGEVFIVLRSRLQSEQAGQTDVRIGGRSCTENPNTSRQPLIALLYGQNVDAVIRKASNFKTFADSMRLARSGRIRLRDHGGDFIRELAQACRCASERMDGCFARHNEARLARP